MSSEILKRDQNRVTVMGGITDDADQDITMLRVDPITKRLLISASFAGVAVTGIRADANSYITGNVTLASGTGITLGQVGQTITINSTADLSVTLADVSANSTDATKSTYTMSSGVPVLFKRSGGANLLNLDDTTGKATFTAGDSGVTIGQSSTATYGMISFNGTLTNAGVKGIYANNSSDNALYVQGAGNVILYSNGTSNSNITVGNSISITSSNSSDINLYPASQTALVNAASATFTIKSTSNGTTGMGKLRFNQYDGAQAYIARLPGNGTGGIGTVFGVTPANGSMVYYTDQGGILFGTAVAQSIQFATNNVVRLLIDSTGTLKTPDGSPSATLNLKTGDASGTTVAGPINILVGAKSVTAFNPATAGNPITMTAGEASLASTSGGQATGGAVNITAGLGSTMQASGGTGGTGGASSLTGATGGAATNASGGIGGLGGNAIITSGAGGSATGGSGTRNGGDSGDVLIRVGAVGTGASANGSLGSIKFQIPSGSDIATITSTGLGIGTTSPTHSLTFPSTSTGISLYNTADQTTDYQRALNYWQNNIYTIGTFTGGSIASRQLRIATQSSSGAASYAQMILQSPGLGVPYLYVGNFNSINGTTLSATSTTGSMYVFAHSSTATSGDSYTFNINSTYNQSSGTAGNTDLRINRTETALGSGSQYFAEFRVGGVNKFSVSNTGLGYFADSVGIGTTSPNASSILHLSSTTKGFLPPVMTGAQAEAISTPATGLMIYASNAGSGDITTAGWWGWNGANWIQLG